VEAWKTYDPGLIADLFTEDVRYRYHPYDEPIHGRATVVDSWLGEGEHEGASTRDEPGTYAATFHTIAVEGDMAVAIGTTVYINQSGPKPTRTFDNCFIMRFDSAGRCREFTEWYMEQPAADR